jgi:biofilm PGA synthesis N-glycosyltransferase PgaC
MTAFALATTWLCLYGWKISPWRRALKSRSTAGATVPLTVLIPCRNEAEHLPQLLGDLAQSTTKLRIVVINDASNDGTEAIALAAGVEVVEAHGMGKKAALRTGMELVKTEWVATLDADVRVGPKWAASMMAPVRDNVDAIVGPVRLHREGSSALDRLQGMEFGSMMGWAMATASEGQAENASGANALWRREVWLELNLRTEEASGDDVFALQSLAQRGGVTAAAWGAEAWATTPPMPSWTLWAKQRARWGKKALRYSQSGPQIMSLMVLVYPFMLLGFTALTPSNAAVLLVGKMLVDGWYGQRVIQAFGLSWRPVLDDLIFALAYPFMILSSLFYMLGKMEWKGREI